MSKASQLNTTLMKIGGKHRIFLRTADNEMRRVIGCKTVSLPLSGQGLVMWTAIPSLVHNVTEAVVAEAPHIAPLFAV